VPETRGQVDVGGVGPVHEADEMPREMCHRRHQLPRIVQICGELLEDFDRV